MESWNCFDEELLPYYYWMNCIRSIGFKNYTSLKTHYASPKDFYDTSVTVLEQNELLNNQQLNQFEWFQENFHPIKEYEKLVNRHIAFIPVESPLYPNRLRRISSPPTGFYTIGKWIPDRSCRVAVIGARECSVYGRRIAREVGETLALNGIDVISGMAMGVDSISQQAAMDVGGYSVGVLGCSVNICYPKESQAVYDQLLQSGCILSEFPPNTPPKRQYFPMRNRIISALSDAVVVVEARKKSGTLITVDFALEQGKEVYAVPGRIDDNESGGCNDLIRQGACILNDIGEFVREISGKAEEDVLVTERENLRQNVVPIRSFDGTLTGAILDLTKEHPKTAEEILYEICNLKILAGEKPKMSEIYEECVNLCVDGKLNGTGGNRFVRA